MRTKIVLILAAVAALATLSACTTTAVKPAPASEPAPAPAAKEAPVKSPPEAAIDPASLAGIWQGLLEAGGQKLRLVFHLDWADGAWKATMDSPDQGASGIPVKSVIVEGSKLTIDLSNIGGKYEGTVAADAKGVQGKWLQGGGAFAVDLARVESVQAVRRPQDPVPPYPYREREVRFRNEKAAITLAGTLTVPAGGGPFPAVVLVTGSGTQNRNEEIMNHRPFLVLADYLARRGIAVLRYDDRGYPPSEGNAATATTRDFADDAWAAFRFLSTQPGIDPALIGIAGHSEGGLIAPLLASEHAEVAFIVLLSGPGYRGYDILLQQSAAMLRSAGATEAQVSQAEAASRRIYDVVVREPDDAKAEAAIRVVFGELGVGTQEADAQLPTLLSPWYRSFISYDPTDALARTRCPVLALGGTLDLQVPAQQNLDAIERAVQGGGNPRVNTVLLEGLNHLFQHATTGLPQEYAQIDETFAPEAMQTVADWILMIAGDVQSRR
jgi:uncharacterized protein